MSKFTENFRTIDFEPKNAPLPIYRDNKKFSQKMGFVTFMCL